MHDVLELKPHIKTDHLNDWRTFLVEFFGINRFWGPFLEGPEKFPHPESRSKISNLSYDYRAVLFVYS